jgi:hypothetical protein
MDALQSLVKALSKSEKRYFTLFATTFKSNSDLVKLFDVLDEEVDYDEEVIKEKTGIKNLAAAKTNLRKLVLKSMRSMYEDTAQFPMLRGMLTNIQFLHKKGLNNDALKEARKLENLAVELEAYQFLAEMQFYIFQISDSISDPEKLINTFSGYINNVKEYSTLYREREISLLVHHLMIEFSNMGFKDDNPERPRHLEKIKKIIDEAKAENPSKRGKINLLHATALYHSTLGEKNKTIEITNEILQVYEDTPELKSSPYLTYLATISNQIENYIEIGLPNEAMAGIELLTKAINESEGYLQSNEHEGNLVKTQLLYHHIQWALAAKNYAYLNTKENELVDFLNSPLPGTLPAQEVELSMAYISLLFLSKQYTKCVEQVNMFLTGKRNKLILMNNFIARFIEVLCYYELSNLAMAEQRATNLYKTMLEYELDADFMKVLSTFLRKLCKWNFKDQKSLTEAEDLKLQFTSLVKAQNHPMLQMEVFVSPLAWLTDKLKKNTR